ncbi:hypothetical protein ACQXZL_10955 [Corynebacterium diphtheriae]|uniref:hypothetical protein n=1 Tax=Corynebacterium diphtheriae TaxID=1717 RepID=UPI000390395E|nr:hypothetical protein [Corynebacterium diphtheriae]APM36482.1 hypothetical protein BS112_08360 [Corynebacterium diphtheriae]ERA51300.1 hypothetical protein B179_11214 [Corynebacterium diphtheriae str. Aberdeen]KLN37297.1 hypothetical protein AL08_11305 [Corynebacterium diphtheriae bv. gravis str. ISS 4746]KLN45457.1 hypothetical protein AL09_00175 [Corynebacterium diphtheriae bv. gravis str. ISS 4749]MBG9222412.1 hypothetical protein [Corynebacterium diphtheriae bv. mitis]
MDFLKQPCAPLDFDLSREQIEGMLRGARFIKGSFSTRVVGHLPIDNSFRQVSVAIENETSSSIEIMTLERGDTFCGIPLKQRKIPFQNSLKSADIDFTYDDSGIDLTNAPVSFFIEGGRVASICWHHKHRN